MAAPIGSKKTGGRTKGTPNKLSASGLSASNIFAIKGLYESVIGSIKGEKFYVYSHEYNGECFYIGKGCNGRAWEKSINSRNEKWATFTTSINAAYEVKILAADLSESDALVIEAALIQSRKPFCNILSLF